MTRLYKRKAPPRDVKVLRERFKVENLVFDRWTLEALAKLMGRGFIETLDFPISKGKEAVVFRATAPKDYPTRYLAVKIYRVETSSFIHMKEYLAGDPRFSIRKSRREIIYEWTKKEYRNLRLCEDIGVPVPHPHVFKANILIMDLIGDDGEPAPRLVDVGTESPREHRDALLSYIRDMYMNDFVHADLSEYNILNDRGRLYLIDLAQGVVRAHPRFYDWLLRDVRNINRYFSKYGAGFDVDRFIKELLPQT